MPDPITTQSIWRLLSDRLRSFILKRVGDEHVAADLLQETFLRIHNNAETLRDEQRLTSWVFQVARNLVVDYQRSQKRSGSDSEYPIDRAAVKEPPNHNVEVSQWIARAIDHLPETYQAAVRLFEIDGKAQQQIADRLGLSLSGAKARVQRGRVLLRKILSDCCRFEFDRHGNVVDFQQRSWPREQRPQSLRPCECCQDASC